VLCRAAAHARLAGTTITPCPAWLTADRDLLSQVSLADLLLVFILTKIKRWSFLAESTRPQSMRKAERDIWDIEALLNWLVQNDLRIDFEGYPEKPKHDLLSDVRKLHQMHAAVRPLLETTLKAEDFALIKD
jgi:hypothetical protein